MVDFLKGIKNKDFLSKSLFTIQNILYKTQPVIIESVIPDPIPNSEVKPSAPMVLCLKIWESRRCRHLVRIYENKKILKSVKKRDLNSKLVRDEVGFILSTKLIQNLKQDRNNLWTMKTIKKLGIISQSLLLGEQLR